MADVKLVERVARTARPEDIAEAEAILAEVTAGRYRIDGPTLNTRLGSITVDLVATLAQAQLESLKAADDHGGY